MTNVIGLNRLSKNSQDSSYTNQGSLPQLHYPEPKSGNIYAPSSYSTNSPSNQPTPIIPQMKYQSNREQNQNPRLKERAGIGLYSRENIKITNIRRTVHRSYWEDNQRNSARGVRVGYAPEMKSFLSKLSVIVKEPGQNDQISKQENINNSQGVLPGLWKEPLEDKAKKNKMLNDWRKELAAQVQARQIQKRREAEQKKYQDIKEEERIQRQNEVSSVLYTEENAPQPKRFNTYENIIQPIKQLNPSPSPVNMNVNILNSQELSENYMNQAKRFTRVKDYLFKPMQPSSMPTTVLNGKIDQLRVDILNSQKIFMEEIKGLRKNFKIYRHLHSTSEKDLLLFAKKEETFAYLDNENHIGDTLDGYIQNYELKKEPKLPQPRDDVKLFLPQKEQKLKAPKIQEEHEKGLILGVKERFIGISEQEMRLSQDQKKIRKYNEQDEEDNSHLYEGLYRRANFIEVKNETINGSEIESSIKIQETKVEASINQGVETQENLTQEEKNVQELEFGLSKSEEEMNKPVEEIKLSRVSSQANIEGNNNVKLDSALENTVNKRMGLVHHGTEEPKRAESAKKARPDSGEKDINKMFERQASVFVNTTNITTMDDLKDYKRFQVQGDALSKFMKDNPVDKNPQIDQAKRRQGSGVESIRSEKQFEGDLIDKNVQREQPKKREIRRTTGQDKDKMPL